MITLRGRVVRGDGLGRKLGFPTANLRLSRGARPPRGVWRVRVSGTTLGTRDAVCNVGVRPTLGGRRLVVEVHVPGWRGVLYGRTLTVAFVAAIRAEKRFPSLGALKAQIRRDVASLTRAARGATLDA
ncbi:MAG: riboflavin kinase [Elusimicrobia bacterium]|nr:riboflavin kinase [Elusimicrobiota bacterium]